MAEDLKHNIAVSIKQEAEWGAQMKKIQVMGPSTFK